MDRRTFLSTAFTATQAARSVDYSLEPYSGTWSRTEVYHLLRRTVVSPTVAQVREAEAMPRESLVDLLLTPPASSPTPSRFVAECLNASAIYWDSGRVDIINTFFDELRRWWIGLMVNGGLSIRERMTLFWHNHFAVNARSVQDARYMYLQNQLFRQLAVGNFRELVRRVTIDKAMLLFLDGRNNKANFRNENYARELQELFTIGIADNDGNPNYTQDDVVEAAKTLTGWDWVGLGMQGDVASSVLTGHDVTAKNVYGQTIAGNVEGGPELTRLLDIIFDKEQTARYVIRKLYRFFVHTDTALTPVRPIDAQIEESIIAPLADELRQSGWQIAPVLRRLLLSRHFYDQSIRAATIKSPVDLVVGTIRGTLTLPLAGEPGEFATQYAQQKITALEQNLFHPPGVQGWQFHRSWISTTTLPKRGFYTDELLSNAESVIIDRLNLVLNGPIRREGSWKIDVLAFAKSFASFDAPRDLVADIAEHLLAFPPSASLLDRLLVELVGTRAYEWSDLDDSVRFIRLQAMLRYLMRSTNYQLM